MNAGLVFSRTPGRGRLMDWACAYEGGITVVTKKATSNTQENSFAISLRISIEILSPQSKETPYFESMPYSSVILPLGEEKNKMAQEIRYLLHFPELGQAPELQEGLGSDLGTSFFL